MRATLLLLFFFSRFNFIESHSSATGHFATATYNLSSLARFPFPGSRSRFVLPSPDEIPSLSLSFSDFFPLVARGRATLVSINNRECLTK